jgi:hypothetical protein
MPTKLTWPPLDIVETSPDRDMQNISADRVNSGQSFEAVDASRIANFADRPPK